MGKRMSTTKPIVVYRCRLAALENRKRKRLASGKRVWQDADSRPETGRIGINDRMNE